MYTIRLRNCAFFAYHGAHAEEARLGQRFYVDVELEVEPTTPLDSDILEGKVDYGEAFKIVERIITGERRQLLETLACTAAQALCARFPEVRRALVTVRKPSAPVAGIFDHAEVSVAWPR